MQRSIVKHCTPRSQIMWNVTLNSSHTSSYIINVDQNKKRKQSPRMRRRDCNLPLIYAILRVSAPYRRSRKICFRSLKNFDREQFLSDLHNVPFHVMEIFDDVDDKLYVFEALYNNVLNEHAPIKQVHVRGNQVP